ncbi:cell division protein ZapE [Terrihabitans sp. B22-R8]|uniref:cell division protein ZapE n=1 Tax=Terrihabitans sp. B22-R8 TaxID=3425128 RepID=UPI00403C7861
MPTLTEQYGALVASGKIERDEAQAALAARFDRLLQELAEPAPAKGFLAGLFGRKPAKTIAKGIYVWGEVGRGKSMLMDLFFDLAPVASKTRAHFHAFMVDMHARVHAKRKAGLGAGEDPILSVADAVADETRLLCFDEMQVTDIADAMMLSRLFGRLFERGTIVVATSNAPPSKLYAGGLNRELVLPFIALLEQRLDVAELSSRTDFRQEKGEIAQSWHAPLDGRADSAMDAAFRRCAGVAQGKAETLQVQGREVVIPNAHNGVARFTFDELCKVARGPADFGAITGRYGTIFVDHIPTLDTQPQDAVRRFVLFVDEAYERRVRLIASAAAEPEGLLREGRQAWVFQRTASRLTEMRSAAWVFGMPEKRVEIAVDAP